MTTAAIANYGIAIKLGDGAALTPLAITGATNATPIVITTAAHGMVTPDVVTIAGVGGNTAANGTWIITRLTATTFSLRGSVGNGAYTSGGTATRDDTYATIAEVTDIQDAGASLSVQDVTAHDGPGWVEHVPMLLSADAVRLSLNFVPASATHGDSTGLVGLLHAKTKRNFLLVLPDVAKTAWLFPGRVQQFRVLGAVAGILTANAVLELTGQPVLSAA